MNPVMAMFSSARAFLSLVRALFNLVRVLLSYSWGLVLFHLQMLPHQQPSPGMSLHYPMMGVGLPLMASMASMVAGQPLPSSSTRFPGPSLAYATGYSEEARRATMFASASSPLTLHRLWRGLRLLSLAVTRRTGHRTGLLADGVMEI